MLNHMDSNQIYVTRQPGTDIGSAYFGYRLPFLPDLLKDHTLLSKEPQERLQEVLGRFERFVIGLWKYKNSAYALRFSSVPRDGSIQVHLVGRVSQTNARLSNYANQAAADLSASLASYNYPHQPLYQNAAGEEWSLQQVLHPFSENYLLVELRQHEEITRLQATQSDAYVLYPYWGPSGTFLEPFEVMVRQAFPVVVSVFLQPTDLFEQERQALSEAAYLAQTVADMDVRTFSDTGVRRRRDPLAEKIGQIYASYMFSLDTPFLLTIQIASPDASAALSVARSFSSALTARNIDQQQLHARQTLPSSSDMVYPQYQPDQEKAQQTFEKLLFQPWGEVKADPAKARLPYLVGSLGACTAFRFPINTQAGIPGIAVRQTSPGFETGQRAAQAGPDEILLGHNARGGAEVISARDLTRHVLVTGFTGSGKTNTMLGLLDQIWQKLRIPFLVIESAKKEYRQLISQPGFENLLVFSLGDETVAPFRFNPFEILPCVRVEAHIARLQACFDAALPQFGILPSIIAEAIENIYRAREWKLTDRGAPEEARLFPTLRDLQEEVMQVTRQRGYAGEVYQNIQAAAAGRIGSLLRGSRGRMYNTQRSLPADTIFSQPVVLELNDLNEDDKALTMMFLMMWVREYREQHPRNALQHILVVEEAHNVISSVRSQGNTEVAPDTKAKAVTAFANMITEMRSYGQGIIIADQSPEKLAPDAVRNTNLQIVHQLRDKNDREAIVRAMIMDETQAEFIGKLAVGEAALFRTGMQKASFIQVPAFPSASQSQSILPDEMVSRHMSAFLREHRADCLPFSGCRFCKEPCRYRDDVEVCASSVDNNQRLLKALQEFERYPDPALRGSLWQNVVKVCLDVVKARGFTSPEAAFCYLAQRIPFAFTPTMRDRFDTACKELRQDLSPTNPG